jgi:hypothetical protein
MKSPEKILVATNFDGASKDALQMAFVLAKAFHSGAIRGSCASPQNGCRHPSIELIC